MLAVAGTAAWATLGLPDSQYEPLGPAPVPQGICAVIAACALIVLVRGIVGLRESGGDGGGTDSSRRPGLAALAVALTALYVAAMDTAAIHFREATVVYLVVLGLLLSGFRPSRLPVIVVIALVMGIAGEIVFTKILVIDLP